MQCGLIEASVPLRFWHVYMVIHIVIVPVDISILILVPRYQDVRHTMYLFSISSLGYVSWQWRRLVYEALIEVDQRSRIVNVEISVEGLKSLTERIHAAR